MADNPPPPPPPHGANPKSTSGGLPEGNYDIFIIPPHSAGSGFLYLPSLQPNVNSFAAGFASAVFCYLVWITAIPALGQWLSIIAASGSAGVLLLVAGVGAVAWAFGKSQGESKSQDTQGPPPSGDEDHGTSGADGGSKHSRTHSGPYNTSHSSGSANAHSAPPPRTPQQDYTTPPPRQEYRAPPPPQPEYSAPPPQPDYHTPRPPPPEYAAPPPRPAYTAPPPPPPPPQQEAPKPAPPPQSKPSPAQPKAAPPQPKATTTPQPKPAPAAASSPEPSARSASEAAASWEKAREETRKREEARKKAEELKKLREEALRKKEEAERQARAAAEKVRWEQARAREKEAREREARERDAKDKETKDKDAREREKREREARERVAKDKKEKAAAAAEAAKSPSKPTTPAAKKYERPSAHSYASTETTSAYDARTVVSSSTAPSYTETLSSYAPSTSTARTSPPPEYRGPYNTSDPDKIVTKAVYVYTNANPKLPISQLVSGKANVTDGLVLRLQTEGLFIDDDVRRVPQREWDIKAWSLKSLEKSTINPYCMVRATIRDTDNKRYVFVIPSDQEWKVDVGLSRLRKGPLVRSMGIGSIKAPEMKGLLSDLGWV
ncbi:hypothetical protein D6C84_01159 [Aureobasidium pullulans]|uniref:Uncharacterized protein n=1 Tax=Aureobasidium pullulans TaxID=5580 RepID=A0A4S9Y7R7_AURPU|nr:hypothetical protein D6C84_01159 [Aureobasidium pullulans]